MRRARFTAGAAAVGAAVVALTALLGWRALSSSGATETAGTELESPSPASSQTSETTSETTDALARPEPARAPAAADESSTLASLARIKKCWRTDSCGFSDTDPKANHFEAVAVIKQSLNRLRSIKRAGGGSDFNAVAREWMTFPDDHVRESALELAREHERSAENLRALLAGLRESQSAPLFELALVDLGAYQRLGHDREITEFLAEVLRSGPLKAGETVAAGLLPLLTEENSETFSEAAAALPRDSRARRDLEAALEEFERLRIGG